MLPLLKHSIHQGGYLKQKFFCTGQREFTILAHRVRTEQGYWLLDQHLLQFLLGVFEWMANFWLPEKCSFTTEYFSSLLGDNELCHISEREAVENTEERARKVCTTKKICTKTSPCFWEAHRTCLEIWSMSQAVDLSTSYRKPPKPSQQHAQICSWSPQARKEVSV